MSTRTDVVNVWGGVVVLTKECKCSSYYTHLNYLQIIQMCSLSSLGKGYPIWNLKIVSVNVISPALIMIKC